MSHDQEQGLRILDNALWRIVHRGDCDYYDVRESERPKPCDCPRCVARAALEAAKNWRFHGSHYERTQSDQWPREAKMQAAWMKLAGSNQGGPDHLLQKGILNDVSAPSARDWYVATSVIQWLATNVGMTVLEAAGFKYQQWDQDEAPGRFQRRQEREDISRERAAKAQAAPAAEHGAVPFLSDNQRYSLRCLRDLARARLASAPSDDQNRCGLALSWLDDLLDGAGAPGAQKAEVKP